MNNIILDNSVGIGLSNDSTPNPTVIQYNLIETNNATGTLTGTGIFSNQTVAGGTLENVQIENNDFTGNKTAGIGLASTNASDLATLITISNNVFSGNAQGMYAYNLTSSSITDNTFENSTGTGQDEGDLQLLEGVSSVSVTNNLMENGAWFALEISDAGTGASAATGVTFALNSVSGYNSGGVAVEIDATADYTGTLNASGDWWGTAINLQGGPSDLMAPTAIDKLFSGKVTVGSFLNSSTNTATVGFTPATATEMWVPETKATSGLTYVNGNIQEGIDAAVSGMTVSVAADTYAENVVVSQSVVLEGANAGVNPITGTRTAETIVEPG